MLGLSRHAAAFRTMTSVMAVATMAVTAPAFAQQVRNFDIPAQAASKGVPQFAKQAGIQILANGNTLRGKRTNAVRGAMPVDSALRTLLSGTGLVLRDGVDGSGIKTIVEAPRQNSLAPAPVVMAQEVRTPAYDEIIVTAQKKEESIQAVPISVSAFTAEALDDYKIESGSELLRAIPNVAFSKSNFANYNFSIRGIGTKALSVSSDPAVAISFNNTPLLRNRLFEQEYFDVERVEVLRGPQGTLYGRNATGGVVNMITRKPVLSQFELVTKAEVGSFDGMRAVGAVNLPFGDDFAVRLAGAMTKRSGFDYNAITQRAVNGRDLWSVRASAAWSPSERIGVELIWERFSEDDDRSRTGKQLCHSDPGPSKVGAKDITGMPSTRGFLSQGCVAGSLFEAGAYGVPNGLSLPYVNAASTVVILGNAVVNGVTGPSIPLITLGVDPYSGITQSRNLRDVATAFDPRFKAENNVLQGNLNWEISPSVKLHSQTSYSDDIYMSMQDYNRFNSNDVFNNSIGLFNAFQVANPTDGISPNGIVNDPQLGKARGILGVDMVDSKSHQWFQELRMAVDVNDKINFHVGANYLNFKINESYYVFNNLFTAIARASFANGNYGGEVVDCDISEIKENCVYVDPNGLGDINGDGHNYFRSLNKANTVSKSMFGESYFSVKDNFKITTGLRYTVDTKKSFKYNSQLLLAPGQFGSGNIYKGFRLNEVVKQEWNELTGRIVVDWIPELRFSDKTMIYLSYARGYKGGGSNPPGIDANSQFLQFFDQEKAFDPEKVDALEFGIKNSFLNNSLTLNASAFYYNYKNYQVSQIVDRMALNENFDATMWGAELELSWNLTQRFRVNSNLGYLRTKIGRDMVSIDVMNRTQGNEEWMVIKPWIQLASNCIAPVRHVEKILSGFLYSDSGAMSYLSPLCGSSYMGSYKQGSLNQLFFGVTYDPAVDAPNNGRGFYAELEGNELPNSPRFTFNIGAQYTIPINDWNLTARSDYYKQSKSWSRVYNTSIDYLKGWDNTNISITLENEFLGLAAQAYVKNIFNNTPITDSFLNSDDSGLTANVFTLDPRIFGFSLSKKF